MVAEPQPTRIRSSATPSTTGGWPACDDDRGAAVDRELDRLAVAERQQRVAGDAALRLGAAGEVATPPIDSICEPYSAVVTWPTGSPSARTGAVSGAEVAVGVDLHLDAAVAEDALGDDGDHVDAVVLAATMKGAGL